MNVPRTIIPADIDLGGEEPNAYNVIRTVQKGLRDAGNTEDDIRTVVAEMTSRNYDHMLIIANAVTDGEGI